MDVQDCLASSMRACTSAPVWQPSNSTSAMSFDSLEPPACSGIAIRTSNSAFNSTVPPLKFFTLTQWLPTVPQAALCVLQVRCRWRFRRALSSSYRCDCWSFCRLPRASSSPSSTPQSLIAGFPFSMAISSTSATSIGNFDHSACVSIWLRPARPQLVTPAVSLAAPAVSRVAHLARQMSFP